MARAALFPGLNQAILRLAPHYTVRDIAPQTFHDVLRSHSALGRVVVWSGEADHSIYGDAAVNYAFRAWHDTCHLRLGAPFTIAGEEQAVAEQCRELAAAFPNAPIAWQEALRADVLGVVYLLHNEARYVEDQYASVLDFISHPGKLASLKPKRELRRFAYGV